MLVFALFCFASTAYAVFDNSNPTCKNFLENYDNQQGVTYTRDEDNQGVLTEDDEFVQMTLCNHNRLRAAAGLEPLTWDTCLAEFAKTYAQELKVGNDCRMKHSKSKRRKGLCDHWYVGENLAWKMQSWGIDIKTQRNSGWDSTQAWWDEIVNYVYALNEDGSAGGYSECPMRNVKKGNGMTGHFTQVMWHSSEKLGCDFAMCKGDTEYLVVCVYGDGGNIGDQEPFSKSEEEMLDKSSEAQEFGGLPARKCANGEFVDGDDGVDYDEGDDADDSATEAPAGDSCVVPNSLGKCDNCVTSEQCGGGRYCCPYMKKCVISGSESCFYPIAQCSDGWNEDPNKMGCTDPNFPNKWVKCNDGTNGFDFYGGSLPPTEAPSDDSSCVIPNSLGKCENCVNSEECGEGRFCCPYMKKCVKDGSESCYYPIAACTSRNEDPNKCGCKDPNFPNHWVKCNDGSGDKCSYNYYGGPLPPASPGKCMGKSGGQCVFDQYPDCNYWLNAGYPVPYCKTTEGNWDTCNECDEDCPF